MVRKRLLVHGKIEKIPLQPMIVDHHVDISSAIDFFFVNGNIFFHIKSYEIDFLAAQYCTSGSIGTIMTALENIMVYSCRDLK